MNISYNVTSQYIYINTSVVPVHIYICTDKVDLIYKHTRTHTHTHICNIYIYMSVAILDQDMLAAIHP